MSFLSRRRTVDREIDTAAAAAGADGETLTIDGARGRRESSSPWNSIGSCPLVPLFMFCFFPVHGEGEGEREGEVRAWYDRRSLSVRSDAVNGMLETGDAILSAKDKPDFGRPGQFFRKAGPIFSFSKKIVSLL